MLQWRQTRKSERKKKTWYNHWWKPNAEQPYIGNTKKLLFAFEYSKKTQKMHFTVHAHIVRKIISYYTIRLL